MIDPAGDGAERQDLPPTLAASEGAAEMPDGDLVGRVLGGRYRILRKLGEGAMGAVYLGEHLKIGRQDAIKVLRDSLATDPDTIARFVRGTRNVSMIRHPNICTIYDYSDIAGGVQFVAMEFVPGETLRDLLQRAGKLSLEVAVHIARQAAEALEAAHDVGIVHRDLKPANIMVVPGKHGSLDVKVVDFDIAKGSMDGEGEEVTRMGFVVGTPEYMSPEQLIGDRLDGRSDTYSLALVLYRMLTGTLPFTAEDTQDLMVKRLTEAPMTLAEALPTASFPPALEAAIRRALQRKPAERQATAGEFGREISAAIEHPETVAGVAGPAQPTPTPPLAPSPAVRQGRTPSSWAKLAGGAGILVGMTAAGMLWIGDDRDPVPAATSAVTEAETEPETPPTQLVEFNDPITSSEPAAENPVSAAEGPESSAAEPATSRGEAPIPPPDATPPPTEDEFFLLLERVGAPSVGRTALLGVRDTAVAAWDHPAASARQRAFAAFVAANALLPLGDTLQAVQWLERAVNLRPDYRPYRNQLELFRQIVSGN